MSLSKPTAMDAEELLSLLQQRILQVSSASRTRSAVDFVGESPTVGSNLSRSAQHLEAAAASFGSLPPSPPTFRGRLGLLMVGFINRLLWWQIAVSKRFASAMCDFAQVQLEEQANQQQVAIDVEERLRAVERTLQQLQQAQRQPNVGERP
jgi:hypothetical protein